MLVKINTLLQKNLSTSASAPIKHNMQTIGAQIKAAGQYTNMLMIGDSITNPNNGGAQGSLVTAIMQDWRASDHCGLTLWQGANNNGVSAVLAGTNFQHTPSRRASGVHSGDPWDNPGGNNPGDPGTFFGGNKQFGFDTIRDRITTGSVSSGAQFGGLSLGNFSSNDYPANDEWFNNVTVRCNAAFLQEAEGLNQVNLRAGRRDASGNSTIFPGTLAALDTNGSTGPALLTAMDMSISTDGTDPPYEYPYLRFDVGANDIANKTAVCAVIRFYKTGTLTGFEIGSICAGGYETQSHLDPADSSVDSGSAAYTNVKDSFLQANLEVRGWPNVIWIMLGANDGNKPINDPALIRTRLEKIIERHAAAYAASLQAVPSFVLQSPYACPNVSIAAADAMARIMYGIAKDGTLGHAAPAGSSLIYAPVAATKIGFINTRRACRDLGAVSNGWDSEGILIPTSSGGTYLVDNIHPSNAGARAIMGDVIYDTVL